LLQTGLGAQKAAAVNSFPRQFPPSQATAQDGAAAFSVSLSNATILAYRTTVSITIVAYMHVVCVEVRIWKCTWPLLYVQILADRFLILLQVRILIKVSTQHDET
jgi:hypothetical protein